jgi:hypothetical protein
VRLAARRPTAREHSAASAGHLNTAALFFGKKQQLNQLQKSAVESELTQLQVLKKVE